MPILHLLFLCTSRELISFKFNKAFEGHDLLNIPFMDSIMLTGAAVSQELGSLISEVKCKKRKVEQGIVEHCQMILTSKAAVKGGVLPFQRILRGMLDEPD